MKTAQIEIEVVKTDEKPIVLRVLAPDGGKRGKILMTPDEAREIGSLLFEAANAAED